MPDTMAYGLAATPRLKTIQRTALALLVVAGVVNYIDRATLAVANPLIREELGRSIPQMGYLLSAFLSAYAFAQLPTAAMVEKLGPMGTAGLVTAAAWYLIYRDHSTSTSPPRRPPTAPPATRPASARSSPFANGRCCSASAPPGARSSGT